MTDVLTRPITVDEMFHGVMPTPPEPSSGNPSDNPPRKLGIGRSEESLQYVGGPRDGGLTPAQAEMTSFEDHLGRIHHYRRGMTHTGMVAYLYEDYRWN